MWGSAEQRFAGRCLSGAPVSPYSELLSDAAVAASTVAALTAASGAGGSPAGAHALTALWGIVMMNIGLMGIVYRVEKRYRLIEPDSLVMILGYLLGLLLLFR